MAYGFETSRADSTLYLRARNESSVMIVLYVDDILMLSNSNKSLDHLIDYLKDSFEVRVQAKIKTFLDFQFMILVAQSNCTMHR